MRNIPGTLLRQWINRIYPTSCQGRATTYGLSILPYMEQSDFLGTCVIYYALKSCTHAAG